MKESVRAEQFLYVKDALQYVNGHAAAWAEIWYKVMPWGGSTHISSSYGPSISSGVTAL